MFRPLLEMAVRVVAGWWFARHGDARLSIYKRRHGRVSCQNIECWVIEEGLYILRRALVSVGESG
jgi:hypothetical protein